MRFVVLFSALVACAAGSALTTPGIIPRIVGGSNAPITGFPYQLALLLKNGTQYCGGVIIDRHWGLTAAHCVKKGQLESVRAGSAYSTKDGTVYNVQTVNFHPNFSEETGDYDIAVFEVPDGIQFNDNVHPINFTNSPVTPGTFAVVSGWGLTSYGGRASEVLQQVSVIISREDKCKETYYPLITPRMFCAARPWGSGGICDFDSGGPLVAENRLLGLVSWGHEECGSLDWPDVYTNVPAL